MLLNKPRAFTWYLWKFFNVRNYEVFLFALPLVIYIQCYTYGFVSTRGIHWWSSFIYKWYGSLIGDVLRLLSRQVIICLFFSLFCIVSRPSKQRHQIGYHCEKVFFDMHSGRLSICCISTDDSCLIFSLYLTFVTDFTVNRPVWPSNTLDSFGVKKGRSSLNMIESCSHWN